MIALRPTAFHVAAMASVIALQPVRVSAQWWQRAPADFEECAEAAQKAATAEDRTAALATCNAKFAGRRKPGGGYTYYDFMQGRSFDIAGPNPTLEEQKHIDEQYTIYLESQRRNNLAAAYAAKQQQQEIQTTALKSQNEPAKVPLPHQRPVKRPPVSTEVRSPTRPGECDKSTFACEWPRLSETLNNLKKLFSPPPSTAKKS